MKQLERSAKRRSFGTAPPSSARNNLKRHLVTSILCLSLGTGFTTGPALARDTTPPVITPTVTGTLGTNGWYRSNVSLTWTVSDGQSKVTSKSGCGASSVTSDTPGMTFTCTATSGGGTSSKSVTIKRDATQPTAAVVTPANGASYAQYQSLPASYACADATSGIATCLGTVAGGTSIDTSSTGTKKFSVTATDKAGNTTTTTVTYAVTAPPPLAASGTQLLAWNDLGMHCMDTDYSVFTLLPPFNTLNAQLIVGGKRIDGGGYKLTYESVADPTGSINTYSGGKGDPSSKSNFWDFVASLFPKFGQLPPNVGMTGNPTPSATPAPLAWNGTDNWFEAHGIPITPIDDKRKANYFPMGKVRALNSSGQEVASSTSVLPVSNEMNCKACHASGSTANPAAMPSGGWLNLTVAKGTEVDWRMNALRLHDQKNATFTNAKYASYSALVNSKGYSGTLEATASGGKPIFCDTCHNSNALAYWDPTGGAGLQGDPTLTPMTVAMHNRHANVTDPVLGKSLNDPAATRDACYNCHPGKDTQCLRGAMGNPVVSGKHEMECQSCHGSMTTVANPKRAGWYDVPTCQTCHHDGKRETVAYGLTSPGSGPTGFNVFSDARFATQADTPVSGVSLYRFSTGHGGLQCEACHNSTHAEFTNIPSANGNQVNDNLRAIAVQGYDSALRECTACHGKTYSTDDTARGTGGPHNMHTVGQAWVNKHHDLIGSSGGLSACQYCHGTTQAGSDLAVIKVAKTFSIGDGRTRSFAVNERITCWSCHNGPNP